VWFDSRNAANNIDSQLFYSYSTDGGVTWSANVSVSYSYRYPQGRRPRLDPGRLPDRPTLGPRP